MRLILLATLLVAALAAMFWLRDREIGDLERLEWLATAKQLGVVGYRDPVGVVSRDGQRLAFVEGRRLFETPASGGPRLELVAAQAQIRHVARGTIDGEWIFEDPATPARWWAVRLGTTPRPLFGERRDIADAASGSRVHISALRQLAMSADGQWVAGTAAAPSGIELWRVTTDGSSAAVLRPTSSVNWPAWSETGELACVMVSPRGPRLSYPCGEAPPTFEPDVDVIGPIAFSPTTRDVYFASPNDAGMVDLWRADLDTLRARRVTAFTRDTYAPSISADGRMTFKIQSYRTTVAEIDLSSGAVTPLSTLQAETPSYHPDGLRVAVTYGTWRRVIDDAKYPDIAQDIGVIPAGPVVTPIDRPEAIIASTDSEDQAMAWSPNGKWIVLHSHREQSDDIWLRPSDGHAPDWRISFLGRGAEVGWPRWSPDGRWILYDGARPSDGRSTMFVLGIDQESGAVTTPGREVTITGFDGDITHGEWMPDSATIMAIAKEGPGRHAILRVFASGGEADVVHRFVSEHDLPGLAVSPDGARVAFIAPGLGGWYQIFTIPARGGTPEAITFDPAHKTQPAWSPDGGRLAFTVWSYEAQFWRVAR
jgi:Tol biopolymer transport system component